ncbi:MAG: HAD family phosphatase [Proteobacteria bacterium]|nr:MAG: HAD family phosphatase [Pseudomonadota bacterium]
MPKKFFPDRDFKAFLFDFDGTVADTMPVHFAAWNHALSFYKLNLTLEQHRGWAGRPTREIVDLLSDVHKVALPAEEILKNKEIYYLKSGADVKAIVPVMEIIKAAHGKIPMAIVSGSRRKPVQSTLDQLGISHFFKLLVCAEDYVNGKPAPDCFLQAAAALGADPKDCLVFEDGVLGIQAAHAAGMECLRVGETDPHELSISVRVK